MIIINRDKDVVVAIHDLHGIDSFMRKVGFGLPREAG